MQINNNILLKSKIITLFFQIIRSIIKLIQQKNHRILSIKKDPNEEKYVVVYYSKKYQLKALNAIDMYNQPELLKFFSPTDVAKVGFLAAKTHYTKCH